ncbi:unnamed protein product [Rodentolepis nana]|uniref:AGC-kinase C-terminal domain-containing protein n=1 Tax=Rodentolepis nana TaxID=102285 RepID=A0A0R3TUH7_RODNA|nr:unnamed protein product [Rodentolepis nana]
MLLSIHQGLKACTPTKGSGEVYDHVFRSQFGFKQSGLGNGDANDACESGRPTDLSEDEKAVPNLIRFSVD